jgi:hypothetical protein
MDGDEREGPQAGTRSKRFFSIGSLTGAAVGLQMARASHHSAAAAANGQMPRSRQK